MEKELARIADQTVLWLSVDAGPWLARVAAGLWQNHTVLLAFIGIILLYIRARAADRQARTGEQGHITDRFTKAIEQLGSERMAVRLGAIYALERLSKDSPEDHWTIMEVLTAYVREKATAPWALKLEAGVLQTREGETEIPSPATEHELSHTQAADNTPEFVELGELVCSGVLGKAGPLKLRADTDVQAILTVLGRRNEKSRAWELQAGRCLDLVCTDLRAAWLSGAHLRPVEIQDSP